MEKVIPDDFDPEPKEPGRMQKFFDRLAYIVMTLVLLFLFLSFLVPGEGFLSFLAGISASSTLDDLQVDTKRGGIVTFQEDAYVQLLEIYNTEQEHEFKVCLQGERNGDDFLVTGLTVPVIYDQTVFSVHSARCPAETIIPLHSHPFRRCIPSEQDLRSQESFSRTNPESLGALMCEKDRFTFYG